MHHALTTCTPRIPFGMLTHGREHKMKWFENERDEVGNYKISSQYTMSPSIKKQQTYLAIENLIKLSQNSNRHKDLENQNHFNTIKTKTVKSIQLAHDLKQKQRKSFGYHKM